MKKSYVFKFKYLLSIIPFLLWIWYISFEVKFAIVSTPKLRSEIRHELPVLQNDLVKTSYSMKTVQCGPGSYFQYDSLKARVSYLSDDITTKNKVLNDLTMFDASYYYQVIICCIIGGIIWFIIAYFVSGIINQEMKPKSKSIFDLREDVIEYFKKSGRKKTLTDNSVQ